jgi:type IV pilus assembly protein PilE
MKRLPVSGEKGFSLVELMVVVAIVAVLASVATPAYINYLNRARQSEATNLLLTARLEMEEFYADNNRYAGTVGCLPSFSGNCSVTANKSKWYTFSVSNVSPAYYRIAATRLITYSSTTDRLMISASTDTPVVITKQALSFSVFDWIFN